MVKRLQQFPGTFALFAALIFQVVAHFQWLIRKHGTWTQSLMHFDSNWFTDIVEHGRGIPTTTESLSRWAFLPGMLELTGFIAKLTSLPVVWIGAAMSCLCAFLAMRLLETADFEIIPLSKTGRALALVLLAWSPGSLVFFTFHTEGLFLLASVLAALWARRLPALACIAVVVCVITRNQGVFVAAWLILDALESRKWLRAAFFWLALISGLAVLFAWSYLGTGDAFAFYKAQQNWPHAQTPFQVIATLWFGNDSQIFSLYWLPRHLFAIAWLIIGAWWMTRSERKATPFFVVICAAVMFLQGNLQNAFRFATVCFPLFLFLGEKLINRSRWLALAMVGLFVLLHSWVVQSWLRDGWPY